MKNWIIAVIVVLAAAAAYYFFTVNQPAEQEMVTQTPEVVVESTEAPPAPPVTPESEPVPETVIEAVEPEEAEERPLPVLAESDPVVLESLDQLVGESAVSQFVVPDNVISRVVATIDMLGGRQVPAVVQAIEGPESSFAVTVNDRPESIIRNEEGDPIPQFIIDPANYQRYTPYVEALEAADPGALIDSYQQLYPLFQEAFRQMGYPDGDFNERLIAVIDDLLATPVITGPVNVIKPEAYFLYADPDLESRSAGQKILMRMGNENATRVKTVLSEIRGLL